MSNGVLCTTAMCANAKVQVAEMQATYKQHSDDLTFASKFKPAVDAIQATFDDQYSVWSEWIPFNPECCALQDTGNQAETLTHQMIQHVGGVTPLRAGQSFDWVTIAIIGGALFLLAPYVTAYSRRS